MARRIGGACGPRIKQQRRCICWRFWGTSWTARDGELTLTAESTQGMCITLAHAQKAVRDLLDVLAAERMEEARTRAEAGADTEA